MLEPDDILGWMPFEDFNAIQEICAKVSPYSTVVEIGTFCGRSTAQWAKCLPNSIIYTIDIHPHWDAGSWFKNNTNWGGKIENFKGNILDTIEWVKVHYPNIINITAASTSIKHLNDIDIVFIDGNHSHETCYADINHWFTYLKPTGIMCGHDYSEVFPGVISAVNAVAYANNMWVKVRRPGQVWILSKDV